MSNIAIGIIGARVRDSEEDFRLTELKLIEVLKELPKDSRIKLISGGCKKGGDRFAEILASKYKIPIKIHYPDLKKANSFKYGSEENKIAFIEANYGRDLLIAKDADVLIACVHPSRKGGTEYTIKEYLKLGKDRVFTC